MSTSIQAIEQLFGYSRIGLGCMALTGIYGKVDKKVATSTIHKALELGVRHFDTAELYGPYSNEELVAEALGKTANTATVATKFGYRIVDGRAVGLDSRPLSIRRSVEASLQRLKRDRIDLLYQHRPDPNVPIEDVIATMEKLLDEGKIAAIGLSGIDAQTLSRARSLLPIVAVQNEFSIVNDTDFLDPSDFIFVAHSPLAKGLLGKHTSGVQETKLDDYRASNRRYNALKSGLAEGNEHPLFEISKQREVEPAVVALAAVLARSPLVTAIPGAKTPIQIETCLQAIELKLDDETLQALFRP